MNGDLGGFRLFGGITGAYLQLGRPVDIQGKMSTCTIHCITSYSRLMVEARSLGALI